MIGAIMGIGGALMGALNANSASNQSWQKQHQLMEIQAELNRKNAKFNTGQAKEMWNYTNFENQMKHIKEERSQERLNNDIDLFANPYSVQFLFGCCVTSYCIVLLDLCIRDVLA
jgi:hypothetical protein